MLLSILGFMAMFCSFCMKKFSWGKLLPCLWIFFTLFSIILFVLSGFFLTGSFATFDSCSAYNYYINSTTPDNFNKLNYSNTQIGSIINQCFFVKSQSIFTAFNTSSAALTAFQSILNYYNSALPSTVFTSYVYIINTGL